MLLKNLKKKLLITQLFFGVCYGQDVHLEVLSDELLEITFLNDSTAVRFRHIHGEYLTGHKKITNSEDNTNSLIYFINGYPDGLWLFHDENDKIIFASEYKNGKKHGVETYFYENGKKKLVTNHVEGFQEGRQEMYYYSGVLGGVFFCKGGKKHGIEKWFDEFTSEIIYTAYYINNKEVLKEEYELFIKKNPN